MLRAASRQALVDLIDSSFFGASNYSLTYGFGHSEVFRILFIPDTRFEFLLRRPSRESKLIFQSRETPGEEFLTASQYEFESLESVFISVKKWLERVKEEVISSNPFARELVALRVQVEEQLASMDEELEGFFSAHDAETLTDRLQQLSLRLVELEGKNDKLESDVSEMAQAIEDLKAAATVVNKKTWYRMASGRLLSGLKSLATAKESREFALEAAKKFLLEGPK